MNCDRATRLMSESQDRPLTHGERTSLEVHTWMCVGCRNFRQQLGFLRRAMQSFAARHDDDDEPPPGRV
ncbi:zf-HC2 domain-containing protein [Aquabacterium sp.]|uniref:anti-sigma factor family protein n=1 Tax=Aquabacterium sp. TaxID=1872578 RepID=UPI00248A75CA|nr:zf-HC2 domain-containing protein [Aquabacterium sp.]MDI1257924.1 zf-HC2 domain-containing protein [Aquabacterium sp.]